MDAITRKSGSQTVDAGFRRDHGMTGDARETAFGFPPDADAASLRAIATDRDRAAFVALFGRYGPRLKAWFRRGGCAPEQAEELAQETMLSVWRRAETFDPARAGAATWIFTIARNQRIDALRQSRRHETVLDDLTLLPPDPMPADTAYAIAQREQVLREALATLPAEQAEVIRLSFFEHRPHAEIERSLGIPLGTVKSRLRLAMTRLRARLSDHSTDPDRDPNGDRS
jgi:RNA polymerase sigma-70 factor (ECF subfamily)